MSVPATAIGDLVSVIRAQLATQLPAAARRGAAGARTATPARRYAQENLASLIELRVGEIASDDPERGRKALRVFLEAVLLSHFGEALVGDPGFFQMVAQVQDALEADPACRRLVGTAIEHLLSAKN
jgi:hypothetical protein